MQVELNGERRQFADGARVLAVLLELGLRPDSVVVERNGAIVERTAYGETALAEGDRLEIVRIVGGG